MRRGALAWIAAAAAALALTVGAGAEARDQKPRAKESGEDRRTPRAVRPGGEFAMALAEAARRQVSYFVLYNPSYQKIPYPMGDVPSYFGVCTDVVVRAYRELGIDLQVLVHRSGVGSGDTNIDHRRVEVLRRFFARNGTSLPVTRNPGDYRPGDIVTYHMPDGWLSPTHIAIVAAEKSLAGVPLVIHNRGWGVQIEDWLFAERITGHFRFGGHRL